MYTHMCVYFKAVGRRRGRTANRWAERENKTLTDKIREGETAGGYMAKRSRDKEIEAKTNTNVDNQNATQQCRFYNSYHTGCV